MATQRTEEIPQPEGLPLIGNLHQIPRGRLSQHLLEVSRSHPGIFRLNFAGIRTVFVHSAELVAEISDETRFRKVIGRSLANLRDAAGDGLFTAHTDDPNWGKAHRILLPAFSQRAMKSYLATMAEVASQLVEKWSRQPDRDIVVAEDMTRLTLDTIAIAGFDYRFNSFASDDVHPFLGAMVRTLGEAMDRITRIPRPGFLGPDPRDRQMRQDIKEGNAFIDGIIRARREHPVETDDLLNLMLNAVDPDTGERLDDVNIRHQVITFLVAGHETTSGLLSFALYLLLRNPHVLAQAYVEVDRVLPGDTPFELHHLGQLNVIERVLKEALRLWPTAPSYSVGAYEDTTLAGKYPVRKDEPIFVLIPSLHRDPEVWSDPETFDIDRFLPEAEAARNPHAYKPFGSGLRACIGRQFALTEAKLALAVILQHFALRDPYDYRLQIKETLTLKPHDFRIRARRRQPHERLQPVPHREGAMEEVLPEVQGTGLRMHIRYGTSLGTCREIAERIAERTEASGFHSSVGPLDSLQDEFPNSGILLVVTSTYNGHAPDSALAIERALDEDRYRDLMRPNLQFAVLGCGNRQWPNYQAFPRRIEAMLAHAGAQSLVPRGEADGDGDFDGDVSRWLDGFWRALGGGREAPSRLGVVFADPVASRARVLPEGAQEFLVESNEELLQAPDPARPSVRHIRLRLPAGTAYRTGDHLAVYARNRPELVQAIIDRLGLTPEIPVTLSGKGAFRHLPLGEPISVRHLLQDFIELQDPATMKGVARLREFTPCPHTQSELGSLLSDEARFRAEVTERRVTLVDLLLRNPAIGLTLEGFLELHPPIRPRFYSISSSPLAAPDVVSLTVGSVSGPAWSGQGQYEGVASAYLRSVQPDDRVFAFVRTPTPAFSPPEDPATPVILISAGTGFAPFRGFLQERALQTNAAEALIFYGCRSPEADWLYREEMRAWEASGVAKLYLAFSTVPVHPYRYVQDALWGCQEEVLAWLRQGAVVYVCGDGRQMAPAVRDTLIRIYMQGEGVVHELASQWLQRLMAEGRFHQDVFGYA